MIAIDTKFAVAGWPTPLRSRLRRRNTDVQSVLSIEPQHFFFPATTGAGHISLAGTTRSVSADTYKIDSFSNSGTTGNSRTSRRCFNGAPGRHAARHHGLSVAAQRPRVCQVQAQSSKSVPAVPSAILRARGNDMRPIDHPSQSLFRYLWTSTEYCVLCGYID